MYLIQTSYYTLSSVCMLPHKRENMDMSVTSVRMWWKKEKDSHMIQCLSSQKTCTTIHPQADVLHDSCLQNITSGFKLQKKKWHIFYHEAFPSKPSSHILVFVGQKGKGGYMYMYVMCPREAYEMDVRVSCDLYVMWPVVSCDVVLCVVRCSNAAPAI